jgi:hypothetical protein
MGGQFPAFISPRNRVAQLYPQALGSILVTSYNLQGYGGGIVTCLPTGHRQTLTATPVRFIKPTQHKPPLRISISTPWISTCVGLTAIYIHCFTDSIVKKILPESYSSLKT